MFNHSYSNPTLLRLSSFGLIWPHPGPTTLSVVNRAQLKLELRRPVLRFLFLHTLFFFELYFEPYLIGTTIS